MIFDWFRPKYLQDKDKAEVAGIRERYGDHAKRVLRDRTDSPALSQRDRDHWKRLATKL